MVNQLRLSDAFWVDTSYVLRRVKQFWKAHNYIAPAERWHMTTYQCQESLMLYNAMPRVYRVLVRCVRW